MLNHLLISEAISEVLFFVKAALEIFFNFIVSPIIGNYFNINSAYSNAYWFVFSIYVNI